jgi:hypothetical protein
MSSKDLTFLFGLAVAYAPHRSGRTSTARSNSRPWSVGILRWLTIAPLRTDSPTKPAAWFPLRLETREHEVFGPVEVAENNLAGRRRKKIELKAKALTVFVMPGCADTRSGGNAVFQISKPIDGAAHWQSPGFSLSFAGRRGSWKC